MAHGRGRGFGLVDALNDEWAQLAPGCGGTVRAWSERCPSLAGAVDADGVLDAARRQPDRVLGFLIAETRTGCPLAPRVVLQAVLGLVVRMAGTDRDAGVDDYLALLWCGIHAYPLERRPEHVVANLAMDTRKAVRRERSRLTAREVTPWPPGDHLDDLLTARAAADGLDHAAHAGLTVERVLAGAAGLALVDDATRRTLLAVYADGRTREDVARDLGTSGWVVRQRCSRAVRRLAAHADALLDAA